MFEFSTIEQALEDLRQGKIILCTDDPDRENALTYLQVPSLILVPQNSLRPKTSTSWLFMAKALSVCQ